MRTSFRILNTETQKYALFGAAFGLLFPVVATVIRTATSNLPITLANAIFVQSDDMLLWIIDTAPLFLGLFAAFAGRRQDNLKQAIHELQQRESELQKAQGTLEQGVEDRTRELLTANQQITKRAQQLELIARVAQSTISYQDVEKILPHITELISQTFGFYHVGIFMLDDNKQYAILRAANSEGGQRMVKRGHRLKVGEQGIVGYVTQSGKARVAWDVGSDAAYFNNPELPDTHSEMTLPLISGNELIGALDIQSTLTTAFSEDDISTLSILADQVVIAIQSARLLQKTQMALQEADSSSRQLLKQAWLGYGETVRTKGYRFDGIKPEALKEATGPSNEKDTYEIPVQLRGQTIGRLKLRPSASARQWTEDERAIIESTAQRVALALESARLLEDAQKRASRESFLSELGAKLGASFQLDSILRDTVEELGQSLDGSTVSFQLVNPSAPPSEGTAKSDGRSIPESSE